MTSLRSLVSLILFTSIAVAQTATTTSLAVTTTPAVLGQRNFLIAQIIPAVTGTVEFLDGFEVLGTVVLENTPLVNGSRATLFIRFTIPKTYQLRAVYVGNSSFATSTSPLTKLPVTGLTTQSFAAPIAPPGDVFSDLNGDGHPDAIGNSVRLWTGVGTFGPPIPRGGGPIANAVDFNSDGKPDILTTEGRIEFGNGLGGFGFGENAMIANPQHFNVDLNRDGKPDAIGLNRDTLRNTFRVVYHLGQGGLQFTPPNGLYETVAGFGDFNGNAIADVAGFTRGAVNPGGFGTTLDLTIPSAGLQGEPIYRLLLGDLNGDGLDDVVTARTVQENLTYETIVQLTNPVGGFMAPAVVNPASEWVLQQILDWTGDGISDLLLARQVGTGLWSLAYQVGIGNGAFNAPIPISTIPFNLNDRALATDLTGDGYPDLLVYPAVSNIPSALLVSTSAPQPNRIFTAPLSITPNATIGSGETFTVRYLAGVSNGAPSPAVARVYLLFSGSAFDLNPANACFIEITNGSSLVRLANNAGTGFGPFVSGSSGNLTFNNKCSIAVTNNTVGPIVGATAVYSATLDVRFFRSFNGPHSIFLLTQGEDGSSSGWVRAGNYFVESLSNGFISKTGDPFIVSTMPVTTTGAGITVTGTYGHTNDGGGHYLGYILLLPTPNIQNYNATGTCLIEYNRLSNGMRLIDNAGTGWLGRIEGIQAGEAGNVLSNSSCTVNVAQAVIDIGDDRMKVTVPVTFAPGFGPSIGLFTQALDVNGKWTDMRQIGNVVSTVTNQPRPGPNVSVAPPVGNLFQVVATAGTTTFSQVHLRISTQIVDAPFCHVVWLPIDGKIGLVNDAGSALVGGFVTTREPGTLANSQCTIDAANSIAYQSGLQQTLHIVIVPSVSFKGTKFAFANAFDGTGLLTHWRASAPFAF